MSEVERYWIDPSRLVQEGWHQDDTCVVNDWAYDRVVAERDALQQRLTAADERIDERDRTCAWTREDDCGSWNSACGTTWTFHDDGPAENGMRFCHSCGKTLVVDDGTETLNRSDSASAKRTETARLASS